MAELFHVNKYKYNDEITVEERHYEWYTITCGRKYRRTYTEIVGVSSKTNRVITHKHPTFINLLDELEELGYKMKPKSIII